MKESTVKLPKEAQSFPVPSTALRESAAKDLPAFVFHLHFLPGISVFQECIDLGDHIKGDLVGIDICLYAITADDRPYLCLQFQDACRPAAGDGLIA